MDENKVFDLIEKMYGEMQKGFKQTNERLDSIENRLDGVEGEVKKLGVKLDGPVNEKLEALLDGYKQNSEQLTRIEQEVSKHEEVILKRVK